MTTVHVVVDPATEEVVTEVESSDVTQVDAAVARAVEAGPAWRAVAPADRARLLRRFAAVVDAHVDELAELEVRGAGHTVGNARWEAGNVRDVLDYYAAAPERLFGRQIPVAGGTDLTFHEQPGSRWNLARLRQPRDEAQFPRRALGEQRRVREGTLDGTVHATRLRLLEE